MKAGMILVLILGVGTFALGLCIMMFGWGLEPESWPWIIFPWFGMLLLQITGQSFK